MAKYRITPSSKAIIQLPISIGHKAEKGVEAIEFDLTAWVETYGSGTLTVIMRRWGDAIPYPIALEIDENNKATWTLSDIDTAKAGMAYAQLSYVVGDEVVKKSDIYTFRVMDSLTGEGDPPEAYESWLEHLTHFAAEAMAEVLDIEGIVTDKTLTVDGGIADAKATGDALSALEDQFTEETDQLKADLGSQVESLGNEVGVFTWTSQKYIDLTVDPVSLTPISNNVWRYTVIDCVASDKFVINAVGGNAPRAWGFIDSSNHVLSVAAAQATANGLELTAPTNAVKLIINDKSGGISYKVGNNLVSRVGTLEESGSGLNENAKRALLACVRNVWFTDDSGMSYYEALETALYGGAMPNPMQEIDVALGTISIQPTKIHYTYGTPIRAILNPVLTKCYAGKYKFSLGAYKDGNTYHHQIIVVTLIDPEPTANQLLITDESGERDIWTGTDTDAETVATWSSADYELVLENDAYVFVGFKKLGSVTAFSSTDKTNLKNNYTVTREEYDA